MVTPDCKTIQNMIVPFELNRLSLRDEEMFIKHLEQCKDCKEEFEIHYIVTYGLQDDETNVHQLDEEYLDLLDSYDFTGLVDLKIKNSRKKIAYIKKNRARQKFCWMFSNLCLLLTIILLAIIVFY